MTTVHPKEKRLAGWLCFALAAVAAAVLLGIPAFVTFLLSFQNYSPAQGLFGSPWVGLVHYRQVFGGSAFPMLLRNSLVQSLLGGLAPLMPAFFAGWAVAQVRSQRLGCGLAGLLLLPSFLPGISYCVLFVGILPVEVTASAAWFPVLYLAAAGMKTFGFAAFLAAVSGRLAREHQRSALSGALAGTGVMAAVGLMNLFSPDAGLVTELYNPLVYEAADNLGTYIYRTGLQQAAFSSSSAVWMIRVLFQLLPAVLACVLGALLLKRYFALPVRPEGRQDGGAGVFGWIFALLAAVAAIAVCAGSFGTGGAEGPLLFSMLQSLLTAVLSAAAGVLLLSVFGYGMAVGFGAPALALTAAMFLLAQNTIGGFLIARAVGAYNTHLPVLAGNLLSPALALALAFLCVQACGGRTQTPGQFFRTALPYLLVFGGLLFARTWGDAYGEQIYVVNETQRGVSQLARQYSLNGQTGSIFAALTALVPLMIGVLSAVLFSVLQGKPAE